jgi:hypothetical protein
MRRWRWKWHRAAAGSPSPIPPTRSLAAPPGRPAPPRPVKHDVADVTLIDAATGLRHLFAFRLPQIRVGWKHCGVHPRRVGFGSFGLPWVADGAIKRAFHPHFSYIPALLIISNLLFQNWGHDYYLYASSLLR